MSLRRAVAGVVLAGGSFLASAAPAAAEVPTGRWTSPEATGEVDGIPSIVVTGPVRLRGTAEFGGPIVAVTFRLVEDAADPTCSALATTPPQTQPGGGSRVEFAFDASFPCNRRYLVEAVVEPADRPLRNDEPLVLPLRITVAVPPATVSGLVAEKVPSPGRGANLRWDAVAQDADFLGYEIRRAVGDGEFRPIGEARPADTSFADIDVPAAGGTFRYQVVGMRPAPEGDATVYGEPATAELEVPAAAPGEPGGAPVTGGGVPGGGSGGSSVTRTYRPPTGSGSSGASVTVTTVDTGYQETLPFDRQAAPPGGNPAVVATLDDDDGEGNRETLLLVAGGGVAFSWAMALRLLARKAAPVL